MKWAMALAVVLVFGLAYLDLLREQRLALEDFTSEQTALAQSYASALDAQLRQSHADSLSLRQFFETLVSPRARASLDDSSTTAESSTRVLLDDPSGSWISYSAGAQPVDHRDGPSHPEVRDLLRAMRGGNPGTMLLGRDASASLELGARRSVAAYFTLELT